MAIYNKGEAVSRDGKPEIEPTKVRKNVAALMIAALVILMLAVAGYFYAVEKTTAYLTAEFALDAQVTANLE